MMNYIENLKRKPEHIRKRFAFVVSSTITALIFVGWIASYSIKSSPVLAQKNIKGEAVVDAPISSLTASVFGAYDDIKNIIFSSNKTEYTSLEVTGGKR